MKASKGIKLKEIVESQKSKLKTLQRVLTLTINYSVFILLGILYYDTIVIQSGGIISDEHYSYLIDKGINQYLMKSLLKSTL